MENLLEWSSFMQPSSQETLADGSVCWEALLAVVGWHSQISQGVSPSAQGGHLPVSGFLAITRRASVNVPIVFSCGA